MEMTLNFDSPRKKAIEALKDGTPQEIWNSNKQFVDSLRGKVKLHPLSQNPIIKQLYSCSFNADHLREIHLEYRHAIVQIFTDALLMAQFQSRQLEPRLPPASKIPARFLLTLNTLDEFGFLPGFDHENYYKGNPSQAHYSLFEKLLNDMNICDRAREFYIPSAIAASVKDFLESTYDKYTNIVALLAIAEQQVILYSPPLRKATKTVGVNVQEGYYNVHGSTSDITANAADDEHQDDLWYALIQACTPAEHNEIEKICLQYCDLWNEFWNHQYARTHQSNNLFELA